MTTTTANHPATIILVIALIAGSATFALTRTQYENGFYCNDGRIAVGKLVSPEHLTVAKHDNECRGGWKSLPALCGRFVKGKTYHISFNKIVCTHAECYPVACEVR